MYNDAYYDGKEELSSNNSMYTVKYVKMADKWRYICMASNHNLTIHMVCCLIISAEGWWRLVPVYYRLYITKTRCMSIYQYDDVSNVREYNTIQLHDSRGIWCHREEEIQYRRWCMVTYDEMWNVVSYYIFYSFFIMWSDLDGLSTF